MKLIDLLKRGYFPQELPPPFNTELLAKNHARIKPLWNAIDASFKKRYDETKYSTYSIPKVGLSRRMIAVPNPIHFCELSEVVASNWNTIEKIYAESKISASKPIVNKGKGRAVKTILTFGQFRQRCIIDSFDRIYELKTDIAKYYPSIYTHTLSWAIHTKAKAKANRKDLTLLGNQLDMFVNKGQSGQTIGVPIGPDTSLILSEILGCTFDKELRKKFPNINGYRYVDDYYLYFSTRAEAERVFTFLQGVVTDYTLALNEGKTKIRKFPFEYEAEWATVLNDFKFSDKVKAQSGDLFDFVSVAFKYSNLHPDDSVLKYAIKKLASVEVFKGNWLLYESLIYKIGITEPGTLPEIVKIIVSYKKWVSKAKLKKLIYELIRTHCFKGNSFEVSWALWIAKTFSIKISKMLGDKIMLSNDFFSILIALDLQKSKLLTTSSTAHLRRELEEDAFKDERWLFAYEAIIQKWLTPTDHKLLLKTKYFQILKKLDVSFYDSTRQVDTIKRIYRETEKVDSVKTSTAPKKVVKKVVAKKKPIKRAASLLLDY